MEFRLVRIPFGETSFDGIPDGQHRKSVIADRRLDSLSQGVQADEVERKFGHPRSEPSPTDYETLRLVPVAKEGPGNAKCRDV